MKIVGVSHVEGQGSGRRSHSLYNFVMDRRGKSLESCCCIPRDFAVVTKIRNATVSQKLVFHLKGSIILFVLALMLLYRRFVS